MFDVTPTSERWKEICEMTDEESQGRALRRYVYELESQVQSYASELKHLKKENKKIKKDILSMKIVKKAIEEAKHETYAEDNTDWSGLQNGV